MKKGQMIKYSTLVIVLGLFEAPLAANAQFYNDDRQNNINRDNFERMGREQDRINDERRRENESFLLRQNQERQEKLQKEIIRNQERMLDELKRSR